MLDRLASAQDREDPALALIDDLFNLTVAVQTDLAKAVRQQGATYTTYAILKGLGAGTPLSQKQLALKIGRKPATLTEPVVRLIRANYIRAHTPSDDRRVRMLHLTSAGRSARALAGSLLSKAVERRFAGLKPSELEELRCLIGKLRRAYELSPP